MMDALLTDKPILFALSLPRLLRFWEVRYYTPIHEFFVESVHVTERNVPAIDKLISAALQKIPLPAVRQKVKERFFYHLDGKATEALVEFVREKRGQP